VTGGGIPDLSVPEGMLDAARALRLPPPGSRGLGAMSGGVDSAAAAVLLRAWAMTAGGHAAIVPEPEGSPSLSPARVEAGPTPAASGGRLGIPHEVFHAVERSTRLIAPSQPPTARPTPTHACAATA
jgi:hypothetical protein